MKTRHLMTAQETALAPKRSARNLFCMLGRILLTGLLSFSVGHSALAGSVRLMPQEAVATEGVDDVLEFEVQRAGDLGAAVSVDFSLGDGSAAAGEDYSSVSGTLEFAAGVLRRTVAVPLLDDTAVEATEDLSLQLSAPRISDPGALHVENRDPGLAQNLINAVLVDFNTDGLDDIVGQVAGGAIQAFINTTVRNPFDGSLSFEATELAPASDSGGFAFARTLVAADFNGDGRPDIVVADPTRASLATYRNTTIRGSRTPRVAAVQRQAIAGPAVALNATRVNQDGRLDLLYSTFADNSETDGLYAILNSSSRNALVFDQASEFNIYLNNPGTATTDITSADLNGDGMNDFITKVDRQDTIVTFNRSTATAVDTSALTVISSADVTVSVNAADLNGDDLDDLVLITRGGVEVRMNTGSRSSSQPSFGARLSGLPLPTFGRFRLPGLADMDGDGRVDIVLKSPDGDELLLFRNTTALGADEASFAEAVATPGLGADVVFGVGRLSPDSLPDVLSLAPELRVGLNLSGVDTPDSAAPAFVSTGVASNRNEVLLIDAGDLNGGDGKPEVLAVGTGGNGPVYFSRRNITSDGSRSVSFNPSVSRLDLDPSERGAIPNGLARGDFNSDGLLDFVVGLRDVDSVYYLLGQPQGGLAAPRKVSISVAGGGTQQCGVVVGRFNGYGVEQVASCDGNFVLIVENFSQSGNFNPLVLGGFGSAGGGNILALAVLDYDRNGLDDLAIATDEPALLVVPNQSDASVTAEGEAARFGTPILISQGVEFTDLIAADFDQDGRDDLWASHATSGEQGLFRNITAQAASPSFRRIFNATVEPGTIYASGDINGDGVTDLAAQRNGVVQAMIARHTAVSTSGDPFRVLPVLNTNGNGGDALAFQDSNRDGLNDLLVVTSGGFRGLWQATIVARPGSATGSILDNDPAATPTPSPTVAPTATPSPTVAPTATPSPTAEPTATPSPSTAPTATPSPSAEPTATPTSEPTPAPTAAPTAEPTAAPTAEPTAEPTPEPTPEPTAEPTVAPTPPPTATPTAEPTPAPTATPSPGPSLDPGETGTPARARDAQRGETGVVLASFEVENPNAIDAMLRNLQLPLSASQARSDDYARLRLVLDSNRNAALDASDRDAAIASNLGGDDTINVRFDPVLSIPANSAVSFLVVVDFN